MNNENNTNQTNNQDVVPNINVSNDTTQNINVVNDTSTIPVVNENSSVQQEQSLQQTPQQPQVTNGSTSSKSTPKVVKVEHIKEVVKEVKPKDDNSNKEKAKEQSNNDTPQKEVVVKEKGGFFGRFILFLFIIFLFAFVYYLPEISQYIEDYKKAKSGIEDGSMKSGTMTCTLTKDNNDNLSTIYETTFTYTKNKLKKTEQITSYKLKDDATSTTTLDESENECQELKSALVGVSGVEVSCSKTAVLQKTTQTIDYTKFNAEEITTNIAEYKGFYPEYQLDQSIAGIRKNLEETGYNCQAREY